jgi:hypothetical protein
MKFIGVVLIAILISIASVVIRVSNDVNDHAEIMRDFKEEK